MIYRTRLGDRNRPYTPAVTKTRLLKFIFSRISQIIGISLSGLPQWELVRIQRENHGFAMKIEQNRIKKAWETSGIVEKCVETMYKLPKHHFPAVRNATQCSRHPRPARTVEIHHIPPKCTLRIWSVLNKRVTYCTILAGLVHK